MKNRSPSISPSPLSLSVSENTLVALMAAGTSTRRTRSQTTRPRSGPELLQLHRGLNWHGGYRRRGESRERRRSELGTAAAGGGGGAGGEVTEAAPVGADEAAAPVEPAHSSSSRESRVRLTETASRRSVAAGTRGDQTPHG